MRPRRREEKKKEEKREKKGNSQNMIPCQELMLNVFILLNSDPRKN